MIQNNNIPWSEKYRAKQLSEIRGQGLAIDKVKLFLKTFPKKRGIVLHGAPGIGKTSLAYAVANEIDAEILELNASDLRNKQKISEVIGPASLQKSLFSENKIILVDEVDGVNIKDKGGLAELLVLIDKSAFPIIITANDIWDKKFNLLRQKCEVVQLKDVEYKIVAEVLRDVCKKENSVVNEDVLMSISIKSRGDLRAALNDLQLLSQMGTSELLKEVGDRNREETIFSALQKIFKTSQINDDMLRVYDEVNVPIDEIFLWIEENIPLEYNGEELYRAFDALSLADVFRGRIYRQQHWRFMVYEFFLLGAGIAASKKYNRSGWTNYKKPTRILKIWLSNQRALKKKSICEKYARHCHISIKRAMREFMLIRVILLNADIQKELKLSTEEIEYLSSKA